VNSHPIAIKRTGLVTSVGMTAAQSCAAIRAGISNATETSFIDLESNRIMAHQVALSKPWRGTDKLVEMAKMAIEEALCEIPRRECASIPLLICLSEKQRVGRHPQLDGEMSTRIAHALGAELPAGSAVFAMGRISMAAALERARSLISAGVASRVLAVATDSLVSWPTLVAYQKSDRLLSVRNPDGFLPGEAAGAVLVGRPDLGAAELVCTGLGFGSESCPLGSGKPTRAEGLTLAIRSCLDDAGKAMHDMDFRVTDNSGEQFFFKEATLALSRTLRQLKPTFDIWHPADCIGETGAVAGIASIAVIEAACRKGYAKGSNAIAHWANDGIERASIFLEYRTAA
jgi:3-oxoacyl-[acyl-carrier-protein] synthase I